METEIEWVHLSVSDVTQFSPGVSVGIVSLSFNIMFSKLGGLIIEIDCHSRGFQGLLYIEVRFRLFHMYYIIPLQ